MSNPRPDRYERLNLFLEKTALMTLGGILLALPFAFPALAPVHFVALIPWVVLFVHPRYRAHSAWVLPGALIYLMFSMRPLSRLHFVIPVALALLNFVPYLLFPVLLKVLRRRTRLYLSVLVPPCWVLAEWLRALGWARQLDLYQLGTSQFRWTDLIQVADFSGVYGVTFLIAAVNGALADLLLAGPLRSSRAIRFRTISVGFVAVLMVAALLYGNYRLSQSSLKAGPLIAVVQPNERHFYPRHHNQELVAKQLEFTRQQVPAGVSDLIVWPENAVDHVLNARVDYQQQLSALAQEKQSYLLVGALTALPNRRYHTSAYLFSPAGAMTNRYDKIHMIYWSEYMPLDDVLARWPKLGELQRRVARATLGWAGAGVRGKEVTVFEISGRAGPARFSTPICFETSSSGLWRRAARRGADFLINITGEGILGNAMYTHMLALGAFRAVENRISFIRAANNGMSGFVDSNGRIQSLLKGEHKGAFYGERGTLVDRVRTDPRRGTTFYSRYGDLFVLGCALFATALLLPIRIWRLREEPGLSTARGVS